MRVAVLFSVLCGASAAAADTAIPPPKPRPPGGAEAVPATFGRGGERALLAAIRRYCGKHPGEEREAGTAAADCRLIESEIESLMRCRAGHGEDCGHVNDPLRWEARRSTERRGAWHLTAYPNCWRWEIEAVQRRGDWEVLAAAWDGNRCD